MKQQVLHKRRRFKESNVLFKSEHPDAIAAAIRAITFHRAKLETYISHNMGFTETLHSYPVNPDAPQIIKTMSESTLPFNVGPMAAVAGVLADLAVESMIKNKARIAIVENGGEISAISSEPFTVGLYAGQNLLSTEIGFQIDPSECPIGIATSSATVSHALSFGEADAVTVFASTSGVADAAATAICNSVRGTNIPRSIEKSFEFIKTIDHLIRGVLIVRGDYVGSVGRLSRLINISQDLDGKNFINRFFTV
ncbi:MAG: UPF0280 family protein [Candidatus Bathyarchaeota archaeon]|nr:MAG: UPF0280 family protein [Candidatus Bathyarchaeota archaeon]